MSKLLSFARIQTYFFRYVWSRASNKSCKILTPVHPGKFIKLLGTPSANGAAQSNTIEMVVADVANPMYAAWLDVYTMRRVLGLKQSLFNKEGSGYENNPLNPQFYLGRVADMYSHIILHLLLQNDYLIEEFLGRLLVTEWGRFETNLPCLEEVIKEFKDAKLRLEADDVLYVDTNQLRSNIQQLSTTSWVKPSKILELVDLLRYWHNVNPSIIINVNSQNQVHYSYQAVRKVFLLLYEKVMMREHVEDNSITHWKTEKPQIEQVFDRLHKNYSKIESFQDSLIGRSIQCIPKDEMDYLLSLLNRFLLPNKEGADNYYVIHNVILSGDKTTFDSSFIADTEYLTKKIEEVNGLVNGFYDNPLNWSPSAVNILAQIIHCFRRDFIAILRDWTPEEVIFLCESEAAHLSKSDAMLPDFPVFQSDGENNMRFQQWTDSIMRPETLASYWFTVRDKVLPELNKAFSETGKQKSRLKRDRTLLINILVDQLIAARKFIYPC